MDFELFKLHHRGMNCRGIRLEKNDSRNELIRKIPNIRWSATHRCWYGPDTDEFKAALNRLGGEIDTKSADPEQKKLSEEKLKGIEKLKLWMRSKRYGESTIKVYTGAMIVFLRFFYEKASDEITHDDIIRFNNDYILKNNLSASYQNQVVNAIKLYFQVLENRKIDVELILRPRRAHALPNVLSKDEVKQILDALKNLKHKAMLSLIYACGLRRGELLNLKITDVDGKRGILNIKKSKGNKDRIVPIGAKILELLREYYKVYKPKVWLFEGEKECEQYGERSLQQVLKQAVAKAGIKKPVSLHWLRHSFATHLHESSTDIRTIQVLLGHNSTRTTEIYTHVSTRSIKNIRSPFDDL